jgi:hypothetical protein
MVSRTWAERGGWNRGSYCWHPPAELNRAAQARAVRRADWARAARGKDRQAALGRKLTWDNGCTWPWSRHKGA